MPQHIGKYIVEDVLLGSGSFGDVYLALDPDLQKRVAIKKLKARSKAQPEGEQQADTRLLFTREARDIAKLTHPNIVTVHGFGTDETDGGPYLVMELLEGETLEQFLKKHAAMPLVQKIEIMHQVAEGLQFAHTRGVIHRDIKPANIMVLSDGTAKVMDFAVAPEGFLIGTPAYMAPEQLNGTQSDVLTDVFGYGAVYYELLTGERAFDPKDPERSQQNYRYEPPSVGKLVEGCPAWLEHQIGRLIAKRRDQRMESLEEMLVETRPTLQKLKQDRAAELASGIAALMKTEPEAAHRMIDQVLRLDPLNREARTWRGTVQSGQREQARARARDLVYQGESEFAAGIFDRAQSSFEQALELDIGNPAIEKLLDKARGKAEDCRTAQLLVEEVIDDIIAAGPAGMASWQIESAFNKLTRATRLDELNEDAAKLRNELSPAYEQICDRKMAPHAAMETPTAAGDWGLWYERRLTEARKARKNREFDYARDILRKLLPHAPDNRAQRELGAVSEDREAHFAAEDALRLAAAYKARGDLESALRELDEFAERYPRRAKAVEEQRRALQQELDRRAGGASAGEAL